MSNLRQIFCLVVCATLGVQVIACGEAPVSSLPDVAEAPDAGWQPGDDSSVSDAGDLVDAFVCEPSVAADPERFDVGSVRVGSDTYLVVTLTSMGCAPLLVTAVGAAIPVEGFEVLLSRMPDGGLERGSVGLVTLKFHPVRTGPFVCRAVIATNVPHDLNVEGASGVFAAEMVGVVNE